LPANWKEALIPRIRRRLLRRIRGLEGGIVQEFVFLVYID
jgi:hypothetical protein